MIPLAATWGIAAAATAGVIIRPWRLPEAVWAVAGAVLLVATGLLPVADAWRGVAKGTDVYFFLIGMMLLAEVARREGLFDWLAVHAALWARGSASRLFGMIYLVGTAVTIFMSNDATAVVLTPAVAAVARAAKARSAMPYLLACAFIANAASFVLPISNPANLVIYGSDMPPLLEWLPRFALPSLLSIVATYTVLRFSQREALSERIAAEVDHRALTMAGRVAAAGIALTAVVLMVASGLAWRLGLPTCVAGVATTVVIMVLTRAPPWRIAASISWSVLPLVAGLFVLVEALDRTGVVRMLASFLQATAQRSAAEATWTSGLVVAFACNVMNNLPAGLISAMTVQSAQVPPQVTGAVLIGIDLGPNLSVTGSLATILWLVVLRREGLRVDALRFLKLGAVVMPPALLLALAGLTVLAPGAGEAGG